LCDVSNNCLCNNSTSCKCCSKIPVADAAAGGLPTYAICLFKFNLSKIKLILGWINAHAPIFKCSSWHHIIFALFYFFIIGINKL